MKVIAYTIKGPHLAWSDVDSWKIGDGQLTMWRGRVPEVVPLPDEVIGLHDDAPNPPPAPNPYPKKREDNAYGTGEVERDTPERRYGRQRAGRPGR